MAIRNRGQHPVNPRGEFDHLDQLIQKALKSLSLVPVGARVGYDGVTAPRGWVFCNGASLSRTLYPELFAVLGVNEGIGNGSTTFNVPTAAGEIIFTGVA